MKLITTKMPWGDEMPVSAANPLNEEAMNIIAGIYKFYGDKVLFKSKDLFKFGKTTNADNGVETTIAMFGSVATINVRETYSTTNDIDYVVSSNNSDTSILGIEGHTIDTNTGKLTFVSQNLTLTGQTPKALTTPLARCTRMYVKEGTFASPATAIAGDVYAYKSGGTVTAGVPQTSADVKCRIVAGDQQTKKAATSISDKDYWYINQLSVGISRDGGVSVGVDVDLYIKKLGGVFRPAGLDMHLRTATSSNQFYNLRPGIIVPSNADVEQICVSDTDNTTVSGFMNGPLLSTDWTYNPETGNVTFNN